MKILIKLSDAIETIFIHAIAIGFLALSFLTFLGVIFRYYLNMPLVWVDESARSLMIWVGFIGAAVCTKRDLHFHMGMSIARMINPKADKHVRVVLDIAFMVFLVCLVKAGLDVCAFASGTVSPGLGISVIYIMAVIPFTGVIMLFFQAVSLYQRFGGERQ